MKEDNVKQEPIVEIGESTYKYLTERSRKLRALEENGVDNWGGYEQAMELLDDPNF